MGNGAGKFRCLHYLVKLAPNACMKAVAINVMESIITPAIEANMKLLDAGDIIEDVVVNPDVPTAKPPPTIRRGRGRRKGGRDRAEFPAVPETVEEDNVMDKSTELDNMMELPPALIITGDTSSRA